METAVRLIPYILAIYRIPLHYFS